MMRQVMLGAAIAVTLLAGCGGDEPFNPPPGNGGPPTSQLPNPASAPALKTTLAAKFGVVNFPIGAAIEPASTVNATDSALLLKHFSSITAENAMKPDTSGRACRAPRQPTATPNFVEADVIANYAAHNGIRLRGHTLIWHRTMPGLVVRRRSTTQLTTARRSQQHLRDYIFAVIQRYPEIYAWDVVNEVARDTPNAANPYRTDSHW